MTEAEHDMLRDNTARIASLETKIQGIVPEQCITTKTILTAIEKKQDEMAANIGKLIWAIVLAIIGIGANLVANNIRWDQPNKNGSAQAQQYKVK